MRNLQLIVTLFIFFSCVNSAISSSIYESQRHRFKVIKVADGLIYPWGLDFLSANKLIVTEKNGTIKIISVADGNNLKKLELFKFNWVYSLIRKNQRYS